MKRLRLLTILAVAVGTTAWAPMPHRDRNSLEDAVIDAVSKSHSGVPVAWSGSPGFSATIVVDKALSHSSNELCDSCNDPCRAVVYQVTTPTSVSEIHGVRCLAVDGTGSVTWKREGVDTVARNLVTTANPIVDTSLLTRRQAISPVAKRQKLVTSIQKLLKRLLYYSGPTDGDFGPGSGAALTDFLGDERSDLQPQPSDEVLALLKAADKRIVRTTCPRAEGISDFHTIACATLSG